MKETFLKIEQEKEKNGAFKFSATLRANFYKATDSDEVTSPPPSFPSEVFIVYPTTDVQTVVENIYLNITNQIDNYERNGSGWVLFHLVNMDIHFHAFDPLRASSYIPMPKKFKFGYVNIKNDDQKCFLYSVLADIHPAADIKNAARVTNYKQYENELDMTGVVIFNV